MSLLVLTAPQLNSTHVQAACEALEIASSSMAVSVPIVQGRAQIDLTGLPLPKLRTGFNALLRESAVTHGYDFALIDEGFHPDQFKLLAMDMDSTLITIECIDEIADFVGKKAEVSAITEAAMRGEITNFSESLNRRVALLRGVPAACLEAVYLERLRLSDGAEQLLSFAKQTGWKTLLVSGGFTFFTEKLKERLGLDYTRSNTLEIQDGLLTGRVLGKIVDAQLKRETVEEVCQEIGCSPRAAIVMGDGANDLKMMEIAGASVAFRAKPAVQEKTDYCINVGGLDTVCQWFAPR